jgi:hypothetical protein
MTRFLRTGESGYCICGHHLECHNTILGKRQTCNYNYRGKSHRCTCKRFRAYRLMEEETFTMSIEEFFIDNPNQKWHSLPSHTLEQSPCYAVIDKRPYINENGSDTLYFCKLHPNIENINLQSIEHHCKYNNPELHKSEILSETHKRIALEKGI